MIDHDENEIMFDNYTQPPCQSGDILYIRETWSEWTGGYLYKAWNEPFPQPGQMPIMKWHPSIYMPKEAARIWLKVTDVRVERLHRITSRDIIREGIQPYIHPDGSIHDKYTKTSFIGLWNSTVKKKELPLCGWEANPWVWVIEFERCKKPEEWG